MASRLRTFDDQTSPPGSGNEIILLRGHQLTALTLRRARLYRSVRTAHLERAHLLAPAAIIYQDRRYDFASELTEGLEIIQAGPLRAAMIIFRSPISTLEINEPVMLDSLPTTLLALTAIRLKSLIGAPRADIVSYAIANRNPFKYQADLKFKTRIRRRLERIAFSLVYRRIDRVVFGTDASEDLYGRLHSSVSKAATANIPALPAPCDCADSDPDGCSRVVFLGAMDHRKGMSQLLEAWPIAAQQCPEATLTLLGKGPLEGKANAAALQDPRIDVVLDPERTEIHRQLRQAHVLVLPSQPSPTWREQIGLPILEGLAHGCSIVTTSQTGIAKWLTAHDHSVIDPAAGTDVLAAAIVAQIDAERPAHDVMRTLPPVDGRIAADDWLFQTHPDR